MRHGSLFSGIGGFDLAAEWMGWENVFHCEWNPFGQKILKHYWPNATSYSDITKTDFTIHTGGIDILTGGFPCQPYSTAGKRLGKEDERHLWPEMLRAIREISPRWVVGENVRGLTNWNGGLVFDEVQADLEAEGYEVLPFLLPACAVNAPHRRDRIWFIAHTSTERWNKAREYIITGGMGESVSGIGGEQSASDTQGLRINREEELENNKGQSRERRRCNVDNIGEVRYKDGNTPSSNSDNFNGGAGTRRENGEEVNNDSAVGVGSNADREQRSERRLYTSKSEAAERYTRSFDAFSNGPTGWDKFPTQSPLCNGNDGFSERLDGITFSKWRNETIKGGGNAIVPHIAYEIFKVIEQLKNNDTERMFK